MFQLDFGLGRFGCSSLVSGWSVLDAPAWFRAGAFWTLQPGFGLGRFGCSSLVSGWSVSGAPPWFRAGAFRMLDQEQQPKKGRLRW